MMQRGDRDDAETKQKQQKLQTRETLEILQVKIGVKQGTEHTHQYMHTGILTQSFIHANTLTQNTTEVHKKQNQEF